MEVERLRRQPAMHDWDRDARPRRQEQGQTRAVPLRDTGEIYGEHLGVAREVFQATIDIVDRSKRWDKVKTAACYFKAPSAPPPPPVDLTASTMKTRSSQASGRLAVISQVSFGVLGELKKDKTGNLLNVSKLHTKNWSQANTNQEI